MPGHFTPPEANFYYTMVYILPAEILCSVLTYVGIGTYTSYLQVLMFQPPQLRQHSHLPTRPTPNSNGNINTIAHSILLASIQSTCLHLTLTLAPPLTLGPVLHLWSASTYFWYPNCQILDLTRIVIGPYTKLAFSRSHQRITKSSLTGGRHSVDATSLIFIWLTL